METGQRMAAVESAGAGAHGLVASGRERGSTLAMSGDENRDVREAHDRAARELDDLERRTERLEQELEQTRASWEHKRADPAVPGANPPNPEPEGEADTSPGPESPPEDASPSEAETPPEGAVGPPADT